jgi:hypothetical protein
MLFKEVGSKEGRRKKKREFYTLADKTRDFELIEFEQTTPAGTKMMLPMFFSGFKAAKKMRDMYCVGARIVLIKAIIIKGNLKG